MSFSSGGRRTRRVSSGPTRRSPIRQSVPPIARKSTRSKRATIAANPREEVVLQAYRIGDLGVVGIPCEVYGITGLELKARSPLQPTFVMELANGAAGYIPPPAQHQLGGYTTWPARTAGLEVEAEPKIVDGLLKLLETISGETRRAPIVRDGPYAEAVLAAGPAAYWRCEEFRGDRALDASVHRLDAAIEGLIAYRLPGPGPREFTEDRPNGALQLVDGRVVARLPLARRESQLEARNSNGEHSVEL